MKKMQGGFTLVELIVVIVILGILAATAAPKFMDLSSDARKASLSAVEAAMRDANAMIYAKAAIAGQLGASGSAVKIQVNGTDVMLAYGFAKTVADLAVAMDLSSADFDTSVTGEIEMKKAPTPTTCKVAYTAATATTAPPQYTQTTGGC